MAKKKNTLKPVGTYAQNMNNRLQTLNKGNGTVGSYQERINSLNNFMAKARDEERKRQAEAEQQQRALEKSRQETANMKKLTQDLTYGYNGRYDPSLAYQAKMMGLKAKDVQEEVNKSEQLYKDIDRAEKEYNAQKDTGYAGVQKDRKIYGTDNTLTMDQWFRVKGKERENQAKGYYDNGDDPFLMSEEGRAAYRKKAEANANNLKNRAQRYADYNEDDALAGLFDRIYERDIANEQAIIDNPYWKGKEEESTALARKATLESSYEADRRRAVEYARRMRDSGGLDLNADEAHMPWLRQEVYDWIMTDGYENRTKQNKAEIDAIIDEYITGLRYPWSNGTTQADAINAANSMAAAYESQVQKADEAQRYYDFRNEWIAKVADDTFFNQSNEYIPENAPQVRMIFDDTAQDFVPEVQGDEVDKAYWYANNYQNMNGLQNSLDYANKYMFIALDKDILDAFNEAYNKDIANGHRGERGSNLAEQFLKGLDPYLSTMLVDYQKSYIRSRAEDPVAGTAARILSPALQAVGGIVGTVGSVFGAGKDSKAYLTSRVVSELRSQQNENVGEWADRVFGDGGGDIAKFMLGVVDSIADNVFAMGTGTALAGKGTQGAMRLVQLIMSGSATSNKMIENLDKGMDGTEAALSAVGSGIIEWLTERYSLERIMGPDIRQLYGNKRAMASFLARSAGAEGSEEIASGILETGLDSILSMVYGHEDELKQRYNELITSDPTMSHEEATRIAMEEKLAEIGLEGLAGALSGLGMAGSRAVSTALETRAEGRNIQEKENGSSRVIDLAKQMGEGTESRALAEQLEKAAAEGKTIKNGDLGRLANLTALDVGEERSNAIKETINRKVTQELTDKGISESDAAVYAQIIEKSIFDGGRLTAQERKTLAQNEEAIKLFASYNTFSKETLDLRKEINKETAPLDSIADQIGELAGKPEAEQESAAAAAVQESIQATDSMEEAIDNLQAKNSGLLSEGFAKLVKDELANNPVLKKSKTYLDDIMKIRLAAMTGDTLPRTSLNNDVAQRFFDAAKAEFDEVDADRVVPQAPAQEGQGKATFNGAEYGTDAWKQATEGLSKWTRNVMGAVGEIAARFGYRVNLVNDPENKDVYGFEDANTGAITINVANGFKHHMLVTMAHEMTHWLEQNSRGGYNDLRSFVLESLRKEGVNVQERIVKIMDNYNMVMKPEAGKGMNINQAMAELVAQSSEGLLSSRRAAMELQSINPTLYGRVQNYVKNIMARLDAAIHSMEYEASMSQEAKALRNYREQLANIWFNGRKDAQGQQEPIVTPEAPQAEEQTEVRNEAEKPQNVQYSVAQRDEAYQAAVESGNTEEQQKLVDQAAKEAGYTIKAYHGTGRADRVGTVFLPERATSGPMAFFTDNREIAEGYARDKKDTSIAYDEEYGDYHTQFRYNLNGKDIPVSKLWDRLDWKSRQKIIEAAKHINFDEDLEEIIYDEDAQYGPGGFTENELRYHKGNAIDTLVYVWLDSANLWNREQDFLKVLDLAGIKNVKWNNPDARYEKVYDTYLKIQNPFDTTTMYTQEFIDGLLEWWDEQNQEKYDKESMDTDFWDKNNVTVEEWAEDARREIENGKDTHNWTRIPDAISDYIKSMGYDGIKDEGGKNGGNGHTVWIPFTSEQIKSAEPVTRDDAGNVIPLSQRFNEQQKDIRYSLAQLDNDYQKAIDSDDKEKQQSLVDRAAERAGFLLRRLYHGTGDFGFTEFNMNGSGGMIFATADKKVAETYSNYSRRSKISEASKLDAFTLKGEELLEEAQKNLDKYNEYKLMDHEQREKALQRARQLVLLSRNNIQDFINDSKDHLTEATIKEYDKLLKALTELSEAKDDEEFIKKDLKLDGELWKLKWQDEDFSQELGDNGFYKDINISRKRLHDFLYDGDIYAENGELNDDYIFDNQLALELNAELRRGIYEMYSKPGKQFIIDAKGENWNNIRMQDKNEENGYRIMRTREVAEYAKAHGYDSVLIKNVKDSADYGYMQPSDVYIFFNENQVKSADAVTYDNDGNVIPPSQRFNEQQKDIRYSIAQMDKDYQAAVDSGNVEEQQNIIKEAAEEAGFDTEETAYHGTDNFGFTEFRMDISQDEVFVAYNKETAGTYTRNAKVKNISDKVDFDKMSGEELAKIYKDMHNKGVTEATYIDGKNIEEEINRRREEYLNQFKGMEWPEGFKETFNEEINKMFFNHYQINDNFKTPYEYAESLIEELERFVDTGERIDYDLSDAFDQFTWLITETNDQKLEKARALYKLIETGADNIEKWGGVTLIHDAYGGVAAWSPITVKDALRRYEEKGGIYQFYTKPGKQLIVNAHGANWNGIPFIADMRRISTKNEYMGPMPTESYEWEEFKRAGWLMTTRGISKWARENGFDSVRINNVYDHGGRGHGTGYGDIGIFFNQEDVKSADPVTYDDNGNIIKPSERFTESNDLRYSIAQSPDMEVNNFMMGLNEFNLPTYQEKTMLRQYKDARTRAELLRYGIRERENERKKLLAMEKRGLKENKRLGEINKFLERDRAKLNQLEKTLVDVTKGKGYARLMMNQKNLMDNLVSGQSAADLEETVNTIQQNLDNVTAEMAERAEELKKLASAEAVVRIRHQFDSRGLKRIAAKLKADMNSELENKEIENRLALIALKMKEGKYDAENAEELADLLAGRMKEEYDSYVISELRGRTITLGQVQLKELKGSGRSLNDIRDQLAGTGIRIGTTGSATLDQLWEEYYCKVIPTLDPKENVGNQLDELLKKINDEKKMRPSVYSDENMMKINERILTAAQELIPEIITDEKSLKLIRESMALVARISGAAKSDAEAMADINAMIDKLQKKAKRAVVQAKKITGDIESTIEYFDQLSLQSEAAMWKQERIRLIEQLKSDNTKALMEEADRWRERIEKDKAFREAVGENQGIRRKITTNTSRIRKLLINETDLKNIPEHMKGLAREMLGIIVNNDLAGRKVTNIEKQDLIETARVLAAMKELDGEYSQDDLRLIADEEAQSIIAEALADLEEGLEEYNGRRRGAKDENVKAVHDTLQKIQDAVAAISGIINAERSVSFLDRQVTVGEAADDVRKDFQNTRFRGELAGRGSRAVNTVKRTVVYGNMTPEYYIENLRNRGMTELWQDMKRGENRNGLEVRKAQDHMAQLAAETNYKAWANEKHDVTLGGMKRTLTIGNMMELYAIWQREHTSNPEMSQHLNKGGVFFQDDSQQTGKLRHEQNQQRAIRVTDEEIQAMYNSMTAEQKQLIDGVVKYLSNDMSDLGNEASMRMYGIKKYKETYYFPMKVWDGVKSARSDKGITGTDENRAAHKSWSKRRQHMARNALVIGDFMTDAVNHIVEMINYNTMAPSIENINKVLNYKFTEEAGTDNETQRNLRVMFRENYGLESLKYLEDLLKDLNGGPAQDQRKTLRDRMLSVFKKNAVAGSMSVALQQPLSYIRAAMMINPKYLAEGLTKFWKGSYQEMIQHSGVAVIKDMGRFDMNFGQSAKDYIMPETKLNLYEKTSDVLTKAPEMMDRMTWTRMWSAVKAEQAAKNPGMNTSSEEFMNKVTERFNELMRKTQVYDSILVKSSNMRSTNLGMKVITSFMAEPTLSLNVLADAIRNAGAEGGKKKLTKALATFLLSAIMQAGVKALLGSGRTPDKKKTWTENFLNKLQYNLMSEANPVSLVPGYGDIIEVLKTGELRDDAMGAIGKLFNIVDTTRKAMEGKGKGAYRDMEDTVGQFAQLFTNIPAKNLMRDARAIYNWIAGSEYASRPTSGNVLKYQREANWFTGDNLLGVLNTWMGEAGFTTSNTSYYSRIYQATKNGNTAEAGALKEYMKLAKGTSDDAMKNGLKAAAKKDTSMTEAERSSWMISNGLMDSTNTVTTQYKEGKITRAEAEKLYKEVDPEISENDLWWKLDRMDYQKETGADSVSGYSYRLKDAIQNNKADEIKKTVVNLLQHGRTQKQIKDALSDWKSAYLEADARTKTAIRDAIQKAYKAMGLTAADADKVINGWKKSNKKTK